jgi:ubiquinone biosynthesis protein COQ9
MKPVLTTSQAIRAVNEALGWPRSTSTVMIPGPTLDAIAYTLSDQDRLRRVAEAERNAADKIVASQRRALRWGIAAVLVQLVAMLVMAWRHHDAMKAREPELEPQRSVLMYAGSLVHWQHRKRWNC